MCELSGDWRFFQHKVQGGDDNDNTLMAIPFSAMGDLYDTRTSPAFSWTTEGKPSATRARGADGTRRPPQLSAG